MWDAFEDCTDFKDILLSFIYTSLEYFITDLWAGDYNESMSEGLIEEHIN